MECLTISSPNFRKSILARAEKTGTYVLTMQQIDQYKPIHKYLLDQVDKLEIQNVNEVSKDFETVHSKVSQLVLDIACSKCSQPKAFEQLDEKLNQAIAKIGTNSSSRNFRIIKYKYQKSKEKSKNIQKTNRKLFCIREKMVTISGYLKDNKVKRKFYDIIKSMVDLFNALPTHFIINKLICNASAIILTFVALIIFWRIALLSFTDTQTSNINV